MKITDKYFKKLSKNLLNNIGDEKAKLKSIWNIEIPNPVKKWAYPVGTNEDSLLIFVNEREKRQSFKGENEKLIVEIFKKNGVFIENIKIVNGIK